MLDKKQLSYLEGIRRILLMFEKKLYRQGCKGLQKFQENSGVSLDS